jgi:hypothetical protein
MTLVIVSPCANLKHIVLARRMYRSQPTVVSAQAALDRPEVQRFVLDTAAPRRETTCYRGSMRATRLSILLSVLMPALATAQTPAPQPATHEPPLPVIDYKACPFEGCTFGKWLVVQNTKIFSSWKGQRKPIATLMKGDVVTGLTGVHITYEPDHIKVFKPMPELHLRPGDTILRYMYLGEGYADIWVKGQWKKDYECTFITEKDGSGCLGGDDCVAKVVSNGKKDWWVRLQTAKGSIGWVKVDHQFNCMDAFGGDPACDKL